MVSRAQPACDAGPPQSDILIKYIAEVGVLAHDNCEHAGRNEVNLNDVLPGEALAVLLSAPRPPDFVRRCKM